VSQRLLFVGDLKGCRVVQQTNARRYLVD
jgi:hypothetical protein